MGIDGFGPQKKMKYNGFRCICRKDLLTKVLQGNEGISMITNVTLF